MEEQVKDFDRSIEQAMNEYSANPPFGMWNRISSELEAAPAVVSVPAAAPSVTALIPKAAVIGLIAIAVIETAMLAGYIMNKGGNKADMATTVITTPATTVTKPVLPVTQQVTTISENEPVVNIAREIGVARANTVVKPAQKVVPAVSQSDLQKVATTSEVPVPQTPVAGNGYVKTEPYYFPPVDIDAPEKKTQVKAEAAEGPIADKADNAGTEKKLRSGYASEKKFRFKPAKRTKWHYGKLNRRK